MSYGIALAGGGIRGAAHVGVLLALEESGLRPCAIAGTSAGGIVAGLYASGVSARQMKEIVLKAAKKGAILADPDVKGILTLVPRLLAQKECALTGLLKGERMEKVFAELTGNCKMRNLKMRTVIPSVDLCSGLTVACTNSLLGVRMLRNVQWSADMRVCEAMRATSSVPAVFQPKVIDGMYLVDGGIADVLPVDLLIAAGVPDVLAVDVSECYEMPERMNILEVASHSLSITETRLRECVTRGERLMLNPDLPDTSGMLNLGQMPECMEAGYRAAKQAMPKIRRIFY